ncbi:hypothetical protein KM043_007707 [Ampulex compressa]|nr:hypothetical protein KM043_007707 [Ampulex compressa]
MDAVVDKARAGGVRQGSAAQLSGMRDEDTTQVDAEEAPDQRPPLDHSEREEHLKEPSSRWFRAIEGSEGSIAVPRKAGGGNAGYPRSDYHKRYRGKYTCDTCGKEYTWKPSLTRHKREECGKEPQFTCPVCSAKIRRSGQLKQHLIYVHNWMPTEKHLT